MFTTIITDCKGQNEAGRQETRYNAFGLGACTIIGVESNFNVDSTIEATGNLIDTMDASEGVQGTVVVNVAPRGIKSDGSNGNYFCYFWYKKTLVISSTKGYCLSLLKKFDVVKSVNILPTEEVLDYVLNLKLITQDEKHYIEKSQFRSFDFVPRVARWLHDHLELPSSEMTLDKIPNIPACIWCVDAFGNCKTTLFHEDLASELKSTKLLHTNLGTFPFYERLKYVPEGKTALYIGSSGLGGKRFLEIATQNREGSAAKTFGSRVGDPIYLSKSGSSSSKSNNRKKQVP